MAMSGLPQQNTWQQYTGDGTTTIFTYSFWLPATKDISVYVTPFGATPSPSADIKVLGVDYTVTNAGNLLFLGGTVVFTVPPPTASIITFLRTVQNSIDTTFSQAQSILGANLDEAFLVLMLCVQQNTTNFSTFGLQYIVSSDILTQSGQPYANLIPQLPNGYIWTGQNGGVIATLLEQSPNVGTLRSDLLQEGVGTNGTSIIGYNDPNNANTGQLLYTYLNNMPNFINQQSFRNYGTDTGAVNNIVVTIPGPFSLTVGQRITVKVNHANTGNTTMSVTSNYYTPPITFTTKNVFVKSPGGLVALNGNELIAGVHEFIYDGTQMEVLDAVARPAYYASCTQIAITNIAIGGVAVIPFDTVVFDANGLFVLADNGFVIKIGGWYTVTALVLWSVSGSTPSGQLEMNLYVNGVIYKTMDIAFTNGSFYTTSGSVDLPLQPGDIVQIWANNLSGAIYFFGSASGANTNFELTYHGTSFDT